MNTSTRTNSGETDSSQTGDPDASSSDGRETQLPIRLNLDFMFGRGYLWAEEARLAPWLTLEELRMEIPDLSFPLDARGGLARFQHKRCHLRDIELRIHRQPFGALLRRAAAQLEGFRDLQIRFADQSIHIQVRLEAFGSDAFMSFRMALIPPEPPRGDELHLSLYAHRAFGPLPYPARLMAYELLTGLLSTGALETPGRGEAFEPGVAGDIVRIRPFRMMAAEVFPRGGWKIPKLRGLQFQSLDVRDETIRIKGSVQDQNDQMDEPAHALRQSKEGGEALAAYQAKDAFADADAALFDSDIDGAIERLRSFRDRYELHPELVSRLLDALICDPTTSRLAEARSLCRELESESPDSLPARLARPVIALAAGRPSDAAEAYEQLAATLRDEGDFQDWVLAELAAARLIRDSDPSRAAERLRDVLEAAPRHRYVLEELRDLSRELGRRDVLEETLKRLVGVYTRREALRETYLELAELLLHARGEVEEARAHIRDLLDISPEDPRALELLGTAHELGGQPVRAVQAFSSAAREADAADDKLRASRLHGRVARLWYEELDNPEQALMSLRSGLLARPTGGLQGAEAMGYGDQLTLAADICEELGKQQEAIGYWSELVALLGRLIDRRDTHVDTFVDDSGEPLRATTDASGVFDLGRVDEMNMPSIEDLPDTDELESRLARAQRHLAALYDDRGRPDAAASHWKRVVELHPGALDAIAWLDDHHQKRGRPEQAVALLEELLDDHGGDDALGDRWQGELHRRLARLHDAMHDEESAEKHRSMAQRLTGDDVDLGGETDVDSPAPVTGFEPEDAPLAGEPPPGAIQPGESEASSSGAEHDTEDQATGTLPSPDDGDLPTRAAQSSGDSRTSLDADEDPTDQGRSDDAAADDLLWGDDQSPATQRIEYERVRGFRRKYRDLMGNSPAEESASDAVKPDRPDVSESPDDEWDNSGTPERGTGPATDGEEDDESFPAPPAPSGGPAESYPEINLFAGDDLDDGDFPDDLDLKQRPDESERSRDDSGSEDAGAHVDESASEREDARSSADAEQQAPASGSDTGGTEENWAVRPAAPEALSGDEEPEFSEEPETPTSQASPLPEQAVPGQSMADDDGTLASDSGVEVPSPDEIDETDRDHAESGESTTATETIPDPEELRSELEEARRHDDHERAATLLDRLVDLHHSDRVDIDDRQHLRDRRDLGELLFFDLDRPSEAKPHLEAVRHGDPEGIGADRMVLSALETIYEDSGDVDGRADILRARLETASSEEMRETYRMLLAQLHWEDDGDARRAERWLEEILQRDPTHEGAHRLYAEIAEARGDYDAAADHLASVLEVAGDGLDAVEIQRELADILLEDLERPEDAKRHYEDVLEASPGDARALEGIQTCQRATGDSRGLLESLARELGLLIGRPQGISPLEMSDINPSEVDEGARIPAAQILGDAAEIVEKEMGDVNGARQLWETARRVWPDYVEALERRISLDRRLGDNDALAKGLEALADHLIDGDQKVETLGDAAGIYAERLDDPKEARRVLGRAIRVAQDESLGSERIDELAQRRKRLGDSEGSS